MAHPRNRTERRKHRLRIINKRIRDVLDRGLDHDFLYDCHIGGFSKYHPHFLVVDLNVFVKIKIQKSIVDHLLRTMTMKTNKEILIDIDYELLFNEFCEELKNNKAEAFKVRFFREWFKKNRRNLWRVMLKKGSNHGNIAAERRFEELADSILEIWESLGLLNFRKDTRIRRRLIFNYDIFDVML